MHKLGPYELLERIAVGGMAEIYLARICGLEGFEKRYVLKILHDNLTKDPSFSRILIDEAKLSAQLNHCNIAQVYDLGKDNDILYIVMEYINGRDLQDLMVHARRNQLSIPLDIAAYIAHEACAALYHAHNCTDKSGKLLNLVHRDITPHNILVSHQGEVKLIDFGIAKIESKVRETTRAGIIKGKFAYMSPEQAWDRPLDGRSDIFSLGLCLYELVAGRPAYKKEEDPLAMLLKIREAGIAPPSTHRKDMPPQLDAIIMRSLAPIPEQRYSTALDFQRDLATFLATYNPAFITNDLARYIHHLFSSAVGDHDYQQDRFEEDEVIEILSDDDILESDEIDAFQSSQSISVSVENTDKLSHQDLTSEFKLRQSQAQPKRMTGEHTEFIEEAQIVATYENAPANHPRSRTGRSTRTRDNKTTIERQKVSRSRRDDIPKDDDLDNTIAEPQKHTIPVEMLNSSSDN